MALEEVLISLTQSIADLSAATRALAAAQSGAPVPMTQAVPLPPSTSAPSETWASLAKTTQIPPSSFTAPAAAANAPVIPHEVPLDLTTMQRSLAAIAEKLGTPQPVVDIMNRMGAQRLSEIPQERYPDLLAAAKALVK